MSEHRYDRFLPAAKLGVPGEIKQAFIDALRDMENGRITDEQFYMGKLQVCGTAACVAGWCGIKLALRRGHEVRNGNDYSNDVDVAMHEVYHLSQYNESRSGIELGKLFHAYHDYEHHHNDDLPVRAGASALRRWLTTGRGGWTKREVEARPKATSYA